MKTDEELEEQYSAEMSSTYHNIQLWRNNDLNRREHTDLHSCGNLPVRPSWVPQLVVWL